MNEVQLHEIATLTTTIERLRAVLLEIRAKHGGGDHEAICGWTLANCLQCKAIDSVLSFPPDGRVPLLEEVARTAREFRSCAFGETNKPMLALADALDALDVFEKKKT